MPLHRFLPVSSFLALCLIGQAWAEVRLPSHFSDHLVLQRDAALPIWGTADPGEEVVVTFQQQEQKTTAGDDGRWSVHLAKTPAGGPYELTVQGKNTVTLKDVLVGEVWLASGQSNMDFTVAKTEKYYFAGTKDEAEEVAAANHPQLRMFTADWTMRAEPQRDVEGAWKVCTPENVREFSAVAYFFARALQRELGVPVGILTSTYGASTAEAWMSREALATEAALQPRLEKLDAAVNAFAADPTIAAGYARASQRWEEKAAEAKAAGQKLPRRPKNPDPVQDQHNATVLYNGMIAPLIPYAIRGAIWYQGESSVNDAPVYPLLQSTLIRDWRTRWGAGDFPFFYVQLASNHAPKPEPGNSRLASFREAQRKGLAVANTGMAVTIDIGDEKNVHPSNKQDVGARLARLALAKTYGKPVESSGPVLESVEAEGSTLRLKFAHCEKGLVAKDGALKHFAVAGKDGKWKWAEARIDGQTVVLSCAEIEAPIQVRYAWADHPEGCNLTNAEGLPAGPFSASVK